MAKVNNVGLNLGQKIANPFKTSRTSTTNPFKNSDFEGSTLVSADIFEGYVNKKQNKLKMIASSVAGSMTKLRSSIAEPIVNFVNRVRSGISSAWDYAKNTNVSDVAGIKSVSELLNRDVLDIGKGISSSITNTISSVGNNISGMAKSISDKMSFLNTDVTEIGKALSSKWSNLVSNIHSNKITKDTSVEELRNMWIEINNASMKEGA